MNSLGTLQSPPMTTEVAGSARGIPWNPLVVDDRIRRRQLGRAVMASTVGTTVEWYDFFLYNAAAALVFPRLFFPSSDPYVATLLSFSTLFAGFAARPVGAAIFGHFGDRIGRRALLVTTMMVMGVATMAIGLVPSYASIGIWGAVLLTVLRSLQGAAVGGEWSGSVLLSGEWAKEHRRGLSTSFAQMGAPLGLILANGALSVMSLVQDDAAFLAWGWRVPFLLSFVLVVIGMYIRISVLESPVFERLKLEGRVVRAPLVKVVSENWREVVLTTLVRTGQLVPYYVFTTYILSYGTQVLGMSRTTLLTCMSLRSLTSIVIIPVAGHLSDVYGRKRVVGAGLIGVAVWSFVYFELLDTTAIPLILIAMVVDSVVQDLQYAPQAALIAENFPASRRYSGSGLGYHLAAITAAGPAPLVAAYLYERFQTPLAIVAFVLASTVVSFATFPWLKDRAGSLDDF
jgi:MFS family permease